MAGTGKSFLNPACLNYNKHECAYPALRDPVGARVAPVGRPNIAYAGRCNLIIAHEGVGEGALVAKVPSG